MRTQSKAVRVGFLRVKFPSEGVSVNEEGVMVGYIWRRGKPVIGVSVYPNLPHSNVKFTSDAV